MAAAPPPGLPPPSTAPPPAATPPLVTTPPPFSPPASVPPPSSPPPVPASAPPPSLTPPPPKSAPPPTVTPPAPSPPVPSKSPPLSQPPPTKRPSPASHSPHGRSPGPPPPPPPPPPKSDDSPSIAPVLVGIAAGGVVVVLLLVLVLFLCCKRRKKEPFGFYHGGPEDHYVGEWQYQSTPPPPNAGKVPSYVSPPPPLFSNSGGSAWNLSGPENSLRSQSPGLALGIAKSTFTYEELMLATDGFSNANLLGQGGFGYVHRGMLPNGKEIAVKQVKAGSRQGDREFQAEVEIIGRVHHRHLVSLVGYCITADKKLLVYEYVPNNTLEFHLHGKGRPTLEWFTRLKIALGSAKGLAYLHEDCNPKIIHRDIKAANILLDYKFEPKVSDFGLAKFASDANTHVSTRVMGTFGYLAPEYATTGKISDKSDVFSFGVVLLELITGRKPVDATNTLMDDSLVDWARPLLTKAIEDGNYDSFVDPRLEKKYNVNEMFHMIACAAACVRHSARRRPRMTQVVRALEGDSPRDDLSEGTMPIHGSAFGPYGGSDYDSNQYNEDMKRFRKIALPGQENASSGYSAATSEYGQNPSASSSEHVTGEMDVSKQKHASGPH